jgi:hypothetical protein
MELLKHLKRSLETCIVCHSSSSGQRKVDRGTVGFGQPAAEDGDATWQQPAAPTPGLGPASDDPSPGRLATCGGRHPRLRSAR